MCLTLWCVDQMQNYVYTLIYTLPKWLVVVYQHHYIRQLMIWSDAEFASETRIVRKSCVSFDELISSLERKKFEVGSIY